MDTLYFTPQRKKKEKIKSYKDYLRESDYSQKTKEFYLKDEKNKDL